MEARDVERYNEDVEILVGRYVKKSRLMLETRNGDTFYDQEDLDRVRDHNFICKNIRKNLTLKMREEDIETRETKKFLRDNVGGSSPEQMRITVEALWTLNKPREAETLDEFLRLFRLQQSSYNHKVKEAESKRLFDCNRVEKELQRIRINSEKLLQVARVVSGAKVRHFQLIGPENKHYFGYLQKLYESTSSDIRIKAKKHLKELPANPKIPVDKNKNKPHEDLARIIKLDKNTYGILTDGVVKFEMLDFDLAVSKFESFDIKDRVSGLPKSSVEHEIEAMGDTLESFSIKIPSGGCPSNLYGNIHGHYFPKVGRRI